MIWKLGFKKIGSIAFQIAATAAGLCCSPVVNQNLSGFWKLAENMFSIWRRNIKIITFTRKKHYAYFKETMWLKYDWNFRLEKWTFNNSPHFRCELFEHYFDEMSVCATLWSIIYKGEAICDFQLKFGTNHVLRDTWIFFDSLFSEDQNW